MSLATTIAADSKAPRRRAAKATKAEVARPQKVSLYLSPKVAKALGVHALMEGKSQSALAEAILADSLKRFVVQDRAKPAEDAGRDDQVADGEMIGNLDA